MTKAMQRDFEDLLLEALRGPVLIWADEVHFRWTGERLMSSDPFSSGWTILKRGASHEVHTGFIRNGIDLLARRGAKCHYGDGYRLQAQARTFLEDPGSIDGYDRRSLAGNALQAGLFGEIRYGMSQA